MSTIKKEITPELIRAYLQILGRIKQDNFKAVYLTDQEKQQTQGNKIIKK